ncbi:hypothetical protein PR202_gb07674 [Eleusine coracana subsp. coracana]|uniref:Protein kinase domain-containing protein n=1 Tax=Eleusine coracana subsp. coracana TaxID=191504 RepID=A0AAV5EDN5_ELECO|nr:hypothetical protein PR202_gb07674 [Eleusine coracana subsp. coracana]
MAAESVHVEMEAPIEVEVEVVPAPPAVEERGRGAMRWTTAMSSFVLRRMCQLISTRVRTDKAFKEVYLNQVAKELQEFSGIEVTETQSASMLFFTSVAGAQLGSGNLLIDDAELLWSYRQQTQICLGLDIRYRIALGVARAMLYMHNNRPEWVLHCNINPWSIRLDDNFCPKMSGFELSKMTRKDKMTFNGSQGTMGYTAPECSVDGEPITAKADVYSYGVMLLEIITGRSNKEVKDSVFIVSCLTRATLQLAGHLHSIQVVNPLATIFSVQHIDPQSMSMVERMVKTAIWCVQSRAVMRPSMDNVIKMLQGSIDITKPPKPYILLP